MAKGNLSNHLVQLGVLCGRGWETQDHMLEAAQRHIGFSCSMTYTQGTDPDAHGAQAGESRPAGQRRSGQQTHGHLTGRTPHEVPRGQQETHLQPSKFSRDADNPNI